MTHDPMIVAAHECAPVTVTEGDHTYPAWLVYWHPGRGSGHGRARVVLANGTSRTVRHDQVALGAEVAA